MDDGNHGRNWVPQGGVLNKEHMPRVKSRQAAINMMEQGQSFYVEPGSAPGRVHQAFVAQVAPTQSTVWHQYYGKPSENMSTQYRKLLPKATPTSNEVRSVTRANKAIVAGTGRPSDADRTPFPSSARPYTLEGLTTANLIRLNESYSTQGIEGMRQSTGAGTGIMAELLAHKWASRNQGRDTTKDIVNSLEAKYPQMKPGGLSSTGVTREAIAKQVSASKLSAAHAAAGRWEQKQVMGSYKGYNKNEYIQRKFNKHGLGNLPSRK